MRLNYYRFSGEVDEATRLKEGCAVILKSGETIHTDSIPEDKRHLVKEIDDTISGISVTYAKQLLKKYGGSAWTEHFDREGSLFEVTEINLKGNNSRFRYNRHL